MEIVLGNIQGLQDGAALLPSLPVAVSLPEPPRENFAQVCFFFTIFEYRIIVSGTKLSNILNTVRDTG